MPRDPRLAGGLTTHERWLSRRYPGFERPLKYGSSGGSETDMSGWDDCEVTQALA
jgi:hypothetical protein